MDARGDDDIGATVNSIANARFSRSTRERELVLAHGAEGSSAPKEALNARAMEVIHRVNDKLAGLDFGNKLPYDVDEQVNRLIRAVRRFTEFFRAYNQYQFPPCFHKTKCVSPIISKPNSVKPPRYK